MKTPFISNILKATNMLFAHLLLEAELLYREAMTVLYVYGTLSLDKIDGFWLVINRKVI